MMNQCMGKVSYYGREQPCSSVNASVRADGEIWCPQHYPGRVSRYDAGLAAGRLESAERIKELEDAVWEGLAAIVVHDSQGCKDCTAAMPQMEQAIRLQEAAGTKEGERAT